MPAPRRAALASFLLAAAFPSLLTWLYYDALSPQPTAMKQAVFFVGKLVQFSFPLVWAFGVERRDPAQLRQAARRLHGAGWWFGLVFGLLILAVMLAGYHLWLKPAGLMQPVAEVLRPKLAGFGIGGPASYFLLAVFYCVAHSGLEEYYWRWFVFGQTQRLMRLWPAIVLASLAFMAHHIVVLSVLFGAGSPITWLFSLAVAVGGGVWAWLYARTGSLYGAWLSHALADAGIFLVGWDLLQTM
ncbi:MAG: CPBP family intramembrane glutamic endopeptidase [Planctomycetota bacterium]